LKWMRPYWKWVNVAQWIKKKVLKSCPDRLIHFVKRLYYPYLLKHFKEKDWDFFSVIKKFIKEGDCVLDVGANIGYISRLLSKLVGPNGCVYCIEPVPQTYGLLCSNMEQLQITNIRPVNVAASDKNAEVYMEIPTYTNGHTNFYESRICSNAEPGTYQQTCKVEAKRLDEIIDYKSKHVSFIKMDVEGHELEAVMGAEKLLEQCRPALLIEVEGNLDDVTSKAGQLLSFLSRFGYSPYIFSGEGVVPRNRGVMAVDYLFITAEHVQKI